MTTPKVLGLDVSKGKVTACILQAVPDSLKRYHQKNKFPSFNADREGLDALLALDFDVAVMEPTGIHYAKIWIHHLEKSGKPIRWVGHREIRHYRESHKLPNKSDNADALAIAAYAVERWNQHSAFIEGEGEELKYLYFQVQTLTRTRVGIVNRLRQELCHDWPEVADKQIGREWLKDSNGLLKAIAGEKVSQKWQTELNSSIGIGIGSFSQALARQILELEREELTIEKAMDEIWRSDRFAKYKKVLEEYGIQGRTAIAITSTIYPVERFLAPDGREIIERINGSKRYRSLAGFKLMLGIGKVEYQSGSELRWKTGGSADCRKALYLWTVMNVRISRKIQTEKLNKLRDYYDNGTVIKDSEGNELQLDPGKGSQRIMRVVRRLVEGIFRDLVKT